LQLRKHIIKTGTKLSIANLKVRCFSIQSFQMNEISALFYDLTNYIKNKVCLKLIPCKFTFLFILISFAFTGNTNTCNAQRLKGVTPYDTTLANYHSPRKASFYSAVLPGLGQIYNKKYWKVPIIYGGIYVFIYYINYNNNFYSQFKKAYIYRNDKDPNTTGDFYYGKTWTGKLQPNQLLDGMDFHKRNRDLCILGLAGIYVLNIIDATVDAYLFDYEVSQDLSLKVEPVIINTPNSVNLGLSCSLRF
jgi:hypothetical protein